MKLIVSKALRLVRKDLDRLGDVHARQFVEAIAPGQSEIARDLVETGRDDDGDKRGLVYLRLHSEEEPGREFEGWLLDDARYPEKTTLPDGGAFFFAGTTEHTGVRMSQGGVFTNSQALQPLADAIAALVRDLRVVTRGVVMKENPPFAYAKAPPPPKPKLAGGTMKLRVLGARRYTETEIRAAAPLHRFQFLHSLRPKFATGTMEDMEEDLQLGPLYSLVDPGPAPQRFGFRFGLVHVRLEDANDSSCQFEGWFFDQRTHDADAYWPSATATIGEGRLLIAGGVTFTGVSVKKGRVSVHAKQALPFAKILANGLKKLGLTFDVGVGRSGESSRPGYFGSKEHKRQLKEQSA